MSFTILYVCTGNVCRSPIAELLLRRWISRHEDVAVSSAGIEALVGQGMDRSSALALSQLGIDPSAHRARQFEPWMADRADLILTAERMHRDHIITELPATFRRAFTMKEFARLARYAPSAPPADVVSTLAGIRGVYGQVSESADNMPDPYQGDVELAASIAAQVIDTVQVTIDALGMWAPGAPRPRNSLQVPAPARRPRPHRS